MRKPWPECGCLLGHPGRYRVARCFLGPRRVVSLRRGRSKSGFAPGVTGNRIVAEDHFLSDKGMGAILTASVAVPGCAIPSVNG